LDSLANDELKEKKMVKALFFTIFFLLFAICAVLFTRGYWIA